MYVKTSTRKTKTGEVRYLQLAHNQWDPAARRSVPKIVYSFGREDQLDKDAIRRLVTSLSRLLEPGDAPPVTCSPSLASTRPARSANSPRRLTPAPRPRHRRSRDTPRGPSYRHSRRSKPQSVL